MFQPYPFSARDGFECLLQRVGDGRDATKGPVLLVHGAGVRGNIFNPPNDTNLIGVLKNEGYDVWLENWRGSMLCGANEWNLDLAGRNDHPAAVEEVCRQTGASKIKAVIHCQGSTSFMISAVLGLVPQVEAIVSNAVSLHPVIPSWSLFKLNWFLPFIKPATKYLNPHWGDDAPDMTAKFIRDIVMLSHHEDDTKVGKMVSFVYGAGHAALWELPNLSEATKQWIRSEFGPVPIRFFEQIRRCVKQGHLVSADGALDYTASKPRTDARVAFLAGKKNKCFRSESQVRSFRYFDGLRGGYHSLHEWEDYSHLDIFLGKEAARDVFPTIVKELQG
ncbi:MAG: esterase [Bacteroidetes bacterium]|nr:esterase [Bacteroidota bacterium]